MMLKALLSFTGAGILVSQICYGTTAQERKDDWNRPDSPPTAARGAKSSSSSSGSSSSSSSKSGNSNNSSSTPRFDYGQMSADFDKGLKKSTEEFMKSLSKSGPETDYLKEMEKANKMLGAASSNKDLSVESSLLAQYTTTIISTIQQATQIKLNLLAQNEKRLLLEKNAQIKEKARQETAERMVGLSPMAIVLGAAENPLPFKTSPLSTRTQTDQVANHSSQNALFPRGINSITSRAYRSPEASD